MVICIALARTLNLSECYLLLLLLLLMMTMKWLPRRPLLTINKYFSANDVHVGVTARCINWHIIAICNEIKRDSYNWWTVQECKFACTHYDLLMFRATAWASIRLESIAWVLNINSSVCRLADQVWVRFFICKIFFSSSNMCFIFFAFCCPFFCATANHFAHSIITIIN